MALDLISLNTTGGTGAFQTYATYDALPAGATGGDVAGVELAGVQYAYQYIDKIGSIGVGQWWPYHEAQRINDFYVDGSSNRSYMNMSNGDDIATVTARGWAQTLAGSGTMVDLTDAGTDVIAFGVNGAGVSQLVFTPSAFTASEVFMSMDVRTVRADSGVPYNSTNVSIDDGTQNMLICCSDNATANSYAPSAIAAPAGQGVCVNSSYQRVFTHFKRGTLDQVTHVWTPYNNTVSTCFYLNYFSGFASNIKIDVQSTGFPVDFYINKVYIVELT